MAKRIGAIDQMNSGEIKVDELNGLTNKESAEIIAQSFASYRSVYVISLYGAECSRSRPSDM